MKVGIERTRKALTANESKSFRDAMAKALYGSLFDWLIRKLNSAMSTTAITQPGELESDSSKGANIGVLDIFGFENNTTNSLEQFFINYTNEKLQHYFNERVFHMEQKLYKEEGVIVSQTEYVDNSGCVTLIEGQYGVKGKPGILRIMDEELAMSRRSDEHFMQRMVSQFGSRTSVRQKLSGTNSNAYFFTHLKYNDRFIIQHYAGNVEYNISGFLHKNKDRLSQHLTSLLKTSTCPLITTLFSVEVIPTNNKKQTNFDMLMAKEKRKKKTKSKQQANLGTIFKRQLIELVKTLDRSSPHFISCINPNNDKLPCNFKSSIVLDQIRNAGLIAALHIRRSGYPYRSSHVDFYRQYVKSLQPPHQRRLEEKIGTLTNPSEAKQACIALLEALSDPNEIGEDIIRTVGFDQRYIKIGNSKVFWTRSQKNALESLRELVQKGMLMNDSPISRNRRSTSISSHLRFRGSTRSTRITAPDSPLTYKRSARYTSGSINTPIMSSGRLHSSGSRSPKTDLARDSFTSRRPSEPAFRVSATFSRASETRPKLMSLQETSPTRARHKNMPVSLLPSNFDEALTIAGKHPISSLKMIANRKEMNIPVVSLFHQSTPMGTSLVDLGDSAKLRKLSILSFWNILSYSGELYHVWPHICGHAVLTTGLRTAELRDELYCQMIKQTTPDPSIELPITKIESYLLVWQLIETCLKHFHPNSVSVKLALLSHIAEYVNMKKVFTNTDQMKNISKTATLILQRFVNDLLQLRTGRSKAASRRVSLIEFPENLKSRTSSNAKENIIPN